MTKLIAFYSRADENYFGGNMKYIEVGNTEKAANMLAELTGAELFKIEQKVPYSADYRECVDQARKDKQKDARLELASLPKNLDQYDEIYLGYPNYCGTMLMAVYTFLGSFDFTGKKIYTHEGSGFSGTEQDIRDCKGCSCRKRHCHPRKQCRRRKTGTTKMDSGGMLNGM